MKRAEVWKHRWSGAWRVSFWVDQIPHRGKSITSGEIGNLGDREFPTHAAALAHALAEVALSEKEQP